MFGRCEPSHGQYYAYTVWGVFEWDSDQMKLFVCRTDQCGQGWETVREIDCKCCEPATAVRKPKWLSMVRNIYEF